MALIKGGKIGQNGFKRAFPRPNLLESSAESPQECSHSRLTVGAENCTPRMHMQCSPASHTSFAVVGRRACEETRGEGKN